VELTAVYADLTVFLRLTQNAQLLLLYCNSRSEALTSKLYNSLQVRVVTAHVTNVMTI